MCFLPIPLTFAFIMANAIATTLLKWMGYSAPTPVSRASIPSQQRTFGDPTTWKEFMEATGNYSGTSSHNALKLSAVFACCDRISKDVASLPFRPMRKVDSGQEIARDHDQYFLAKNPSRMWSKFTYFYTLSNHVNLYGDAFSPITRQGGRPVSYGMWHPLQTKHEIVDNRLYWINTTLKDSKGYPLVVSDEDMIHLMWFTENGIRGKSVLGFAADTISLGRNASSMASELYQNGMWSPGYISYGAELKKEQAELIGSTWSTNFAGFDNRNETPVLDNKSEYKTFTGSLRDAEVVKILPLTASEIARYMGVPPSKIGLREGNVSYNSLEQDNTAYVQDTIMPRAISYEEEFDRKALPMDEDDVQFKFELKGRLRGDIAARSAFLNMALQTGMLSINDALRLEDMNTIGPDGDERLVQLNLTTLSKIVSGEAETEKGVITSKKLKEMLASAITHSKQNGHAIPKN